MMAKACSYAQEHVEDFDLDPLEREKRLECVSFQMACFLAQNTVHGDGGVEWEVVLDMLIEQPMKSEEQWYEILNALADDLGGWVSK